MFAACVSRRQFLRTAATTLAAPYVLTRSARAGTPPSERITLGMIGVGNMGGAHVSSLVKNRDFQIVAVCDVRRDKREAAQKQIEETYAEEQSPGTFRGCNTYHEFEELLARPDIDAVVIAVPDHWHAIIAIAACRAGKDVYCEKPLSLTVREAEELVRAARRYGRVFQVGSQQRSDPNFRLACELVRNGRIGEVRTVNVGIGGPSGDKYFNEEPVPDGFDWDRWLGPAPWQPYNAERCSGSYSGGWRLIRDYSGGMITDWGAHHFDIAQWGLGLDGAGPVEFIPPNVADEQTLTLVYASGVRLLHGNANGVLFTGTNGTIEVNRGYFKTTPERIGREPLGPNDVHLEESQNHHENWRQAILRRRRPIADVAIGASTITVCHLANIAWWLGRTIRWNPDQREIVGDEAAARWLDRPKRAPWRIEA
jgi:predicted dehydrogenase